MGAKVNDKIINSNYLFKMYYLKDKVQYLLAKLKTILFTIN